MAEMGVVSHVPLRFTIAEYEPGLVRDARKEIDSCMWHYIYYGASYELFGLVVLGEKKIYSFS